MQSIFKKNGGMRTRLAFTVALLASMGCAEKKKNKRSYEQQEQLFQRAVAVTVQGVEDPVPALKAFLAAVRVTPGLQAPPYSRVQALSYYVVLY